MYRTKLKRNPSLSKKMKVENRASILKKLGLTEEDVKDSEKLLRQIPPPPPAHATKYRYTCRKEERLLGYTLIRLSREKALRILGASEEDVDIENTKNLGSLGRSGRRRSFLVDDIITKNHQYVPKGSCVGRKNILRQHVKCRSSPKYRRRRSTSELNSLKLLTISKNQFLQLKRQNEDANAEIIRLKQRLETLEKEISPDSKLA